MGRGEGNRERRKGLTLKGSCWLAVFVLFCGACNHTFVRVRAEPERSRSAVLVLTGLRNSGEGRRATRSWYSQQRYDVFIPDYFSRDGLQATSNQLGQYIEESGLRNYEEVNVFTYLLGAWAFNIYMDQRGDTALPNLRRIIYDRSAYQEQVSHVVLENMPNIIFNFLGVTVRQFADTPYPPLDRQDREVGLIIECRATPYASAHRDQLEPVGLEDHFPWAFGQDHDDAMYVYRHHDEMYNSFDAIGPEILNFFESGRFTDEARRRPCDEDPFQ